MMSHECFDNSNHQLLDCLFNRLFNNNNNKHYCSALLTFTRGINGDLTKTSNAETISILCHHHAMPNFDIWMPYYWYILHDPDLWSCRWLYAMWLHQLTEDPKATYSYTCQLHSAMSTWNMQRCTLSMALWWTLLCLYMINCIYDNCSIMNVDKGVAIKWTW